jgi:hypothetical protein
MHAKTRHRADDAFAAHRRRLDRFAVGHHREQGDHSGLRKINAFRFLARLIQHESGFQRYGGQRGNESLKIRDSKPAEQAISRWFGISRVQRDYLGPAGLVLRTAVGVPWRSASAPLKQILHGDPSVDLLVRDPT